MDMDRACYFPQELVRSKTERKGKLISLLHSSSGHKNSKLCCSKSTGCVKLATVCYQVVISLKCKCSKPDFFQK